MSAVETSPKSIAVLGATGSIGRYSLNVIAHHPNRFRVFALVADRDVETIFAQILTFRPKFAVLRNEAAADDLRGRLKEHGSQTVVLAGQRAVVEASSSPEVDTVISAIVGSAGLQPTLAALKAGKRVLLANKESMVMAGSLIIETLAKDGGILLPVDSEHSAIFQALPNNYNRNPIDSGVRRVCLTASGGALRELPIDKLSQVTPEMALNHPNWAMGAKVTIDSATMMNKGLELIEAAWLFNLSPNMLDVVIHPQSIVHSMVEYQDGSQLAQMAHPDMRVPIAVALAYPDRIDSGVASLDWTMIGALTFEPVDERRYPALTLARSALVVGGTAPTVLNAANEVAVEAFLRHVLPFTQITAAVEATMDAVAVTTACDLTAIERADQLARDHCRNWIASR